MALYNFKKDYKVCGVVFGEIIVWFFSPTELQDTFTAILYVYIHFDEG